MPLAESCSSWASRVCGEEDEGAVVDDDDGEVTAPSAVVTREYQSPPTTRPCAVPGPAVVVDDDDGRLNRESNDCAYPAAVVG